MSVVKNPSPLQDLDYHDDEEEHQDETAQGVNDRVHGTTCKVGEEAAGRNRRDHYGCSKDLVGMDFGDGKGGEDGDRQRQFRDKPVEGRLVGIIEDTLPLQELDEDYEKEEDDVGLQQRIEFFHDSCPDN